MDIVDRNPKIELFSDGLNLNALHNKADIHILRKSLRRMKKDFLEVSILKNNADIETFKNTEQDNIKLAIEKIQLPKSDFLSLQLKINPYLIFTSTILPENGMAKKEEKAYPIVLQPKFIALGRLIYTPTYLSGDNKNLIKLKEMNTYFTGKELIKKTFSGNHNQNVENKINHLLKKFLLYQFLIIQ